MRQRNTCAFLNNATNICVSLVDVILSGSSTSSTAPKSKLWQLGNSSTSAWTYPRNFRIFTLALLHFLYIYIYIYNCTIRQTFMRPQTFCLPPGFGCHPSAIPDIPVTSPCRSVPVRVGPCRSVPRPHASCPSAKEPQCSYLRPASTERGCNPKTSDRAKRQPRIHSSGRWQ